MLFSFFFKRFLLQFVLIFSIIILVLGTGNLLLRIELFTGLFATLQIFLVMLPLMAVYAIPITASIAVQQSIGDLLVEDELLMLTYFKKANRSLVAAVTSFALLLSIFYVPLIFEIAPQSYLRGKRILFSLAKQQFCHLEPQKFHSPYPGITFFFKEKKNKNGDPHFINLFLAFYGKNERYVFAAQQGYFQQDKILMIDGSVYTLGTDKTYVAMFKETSINLDKILKMEKKQNSTLNLFKFWNIKQLLAILTSDASAMFEVLKRIAQLLWVFFSPLLGLVLILRLGRKKNNTLIAIITSGLLFLFSYIFIIMSQVAGQNIFCSIFFLYFPLFICLILCLKFLVWELI